MNVCNNEYDHSKIYFTFGNYWHCSDINHNDISAQPCMLVLTIYFFFARWVDLLQYLFLHSITIMVSTHPSPQRGMELWPSGVHKVTKAQLRAHEVLLHELRVSPKVWLFFCQCPRVVLPWSWWLRLLIDVKWSTTSTGAPPPCSKTTCCLPN